MNQNILFLLAGVLLGYSVSNLTKKKRRGRVIVDRIDKITEQEFRRGRLGEIPTIF